MGFFRPEPVRACGIATAMLALICAITAASAEPAEITKRRAAERKVFTDSEIVDGFFKLTLGAEYQVSARADRIRKFETPVRIFIDSKGKPDRRPQIEAVVADIKRKVEHLDIAITEKRVDANTIVTMVRDKELGRAIRAIYGRNEARKIQKSLEPQCLSSFRRAQNFQIARADVILVTDAGSFTFYDCAYEELLQALGPINDDASLRFSMFNDKVSLGFFGVYDQYILNMLYHPKIKAGMTRAEVQAVLPEALPEVRAFVAKANNLVP